jgi:hypothetical protein
MRPRPYFGILPGGLALFFLAAGCSHFPTPGGFTGGGGSAPLTVTFHDTPPSGIAVTSFEVTVTGATLQPQSGSSVSLLATPQTIELTQLQTNSAFLSTTQKVPAGTYQSLTITFANPQYTILNDTGASQTIFGKTCAAGQSCVITPTASTLTNTIIGFLSGTPPLAGQLVIGSGQPTLLEVDVNLNDIIQPDFSVSFGPLGAVTATQLASTSSTSVIDRLALSGAVTSVGTNPNQFSLTASTGQTFANISVTSSTLFSQFNQASRNSTCSADNFTCLKSGQIVDVPLQILGSGAMQAAEVDFDDAASTQQVSGTIVALGSGSPPASFQMVVHNTVPSLSTAAAGTLATVTIKSGATFVINNGLFVLPSGSFSFASPTDFLIGQEVEARVSGTVTAGPPVAFTADRFALEQTQFNATVISVSSPNFFVNFAGLEAVFVSPVTQIQVLTATGETVFETQPTGTLSDISNLISQQGGVLVGGFLFNGTQTTPNLTAVTVRAKVTGT